MAKDKVAATYEDPTTLVPWAENPRTNQKIEGVAALIQKVGFGAPIVAQAGTRRIIAGHTRFYAAKKLGLTEVPVRFVDVNDHDAGLMALGDNNHDGDWDMPMLGMLLDDYEIEESHLAGFDDADLADIIKSMDTAPAQVPVEENEDRPPDEVPQEYAVLIECRDEAHQTELLEFCLREGWECRALT